MINRVPSPDSSTDSDEPVVAAFLGASAAASAVAASASRRGSRPGRAGNRDLGVVHASDQLDKDFFCRFHPGPPKFSDEEFERNYRMPRTLYEKIREKIVEADGFFLQNVDAANKKGGSTDLKLFAAFAMLTEGRSAKSLVRETRMSERQVLKCMKRFTRCVVQELSAEWLRLPNGEELSQIEERYRSLGFPGCIGAVDCAGWDWDLCPVAWQGLYKGKDKKPSLRLEVWCDDNLRIWSLNFGIPGSKNDRTIMEHSPFFRAMRNGKWPNVRPKLCLAGYNLKRFYFLVHGIYPRFAIFCLPHSDPRTAKEKAFAARHSSARKAVERVFGVLFRQSRILYCPCRLWHLAEITDVMKACVVLHNMIADCRGYEGTMRFRESLDRAQEQCRRMELENVMRSECRYDQSDLWREYLDDIDAAEECDKLEKAIMEHIWNVVGNDE